MTKRFIPALLAAGFIGAVAAAPAHADLAVTWHMSIDSPMMKNMPPQTKTMIDGMMNPMTVYSTGKSSRTDTPMMSIIIDRTAQKMTMVNKFTKTYSVSAYDPAKASQMSMPGAGAMGSGAPTDVTVTDTGKSKTILGHKCHELVVSGKFQQQQGPNMSFKDDMWVAADLFHTGDGVPNLPFSSFGSAASKIDGFPLEMNMSLTGGQADGTTVNMETTDISTDTLPASTFAVPDGYTKSDTPGFGMGGMGGGMRGGYRPGNN